MADKGKVGKVLHRIYYIGAVCIFAYAFIAYRYYPANWRLNPLLVTFIFGLLIYVLTLIMEVEERKPMNFLILIFIIIGVVIYGYRRGIYIWF